MAAPAEITADHGAEMMVSPCNMHAQSKIEVATSSDNHEKHITSTPIYSFKMQAPKEDNDQETEIDAQTSSGKYFQQNPGIHCIMTKALMMLIYER